MLDQVEEKTLRQILGIRLGETAAPEISKERRPVIPAELGKGIIDFRRLLGSIDRIDEKLLFVEQESYPGAPLDSVRRDYAYISTLEF